MSIIGLRSSRHVDLIHILGWGTIVEGIGIYRQWVKPFGMNTIRWQEKSKKFSIKFLKHVKGVKDAFLESWTFDVEWKYIKGLMFGSAKARSDGHLSHCSVATFVKVNVNTLSRDGSCCNFGTKMHWKLTLLFVKLLKKKKKKEIGQ